MYTCIYIGGPVRSAAQLGGDPGHGPWPETWLLRHMTYAHVPETHPWLFMIGLSDMEDPTTGFEF